MRIKTYYESLDRLCIMQTQPLYKLEQFDLHEKIQWNKNLTTRNIPLLVPNLHLNRSDLHSSCIHELFPEQIPRASLNTDTTYAIRIDSARYHPDQLKSILAPLRQESSLSIVLFLQGQLKKQDSPHSFIKRWSSAFPSVPIAFGPTCSAHDIPVLSDAGISLYWFGFGLSQLALLEQYGVGSAVYELFTECKEKSQEYGMVFLADCILHEYSDIPKIFAFGADLIRLDNQSITHLISSIGEPGKNTGIERENMVAELSFSRFSPYPTCIDHIAHVLNLVFTVTDASRISELCSHTKLLRLSP